MRLLGLAFIVVGILIVAATALVIAHAHESRAESREACVAAGKSGWCGAKTGYLAALALTLGPFLALPGIVLASVGLLITLLARSGSRNGTGRQTLK